MIVSGLKRISKWQEKEAIRKYFSRSHYIYRVCRRMMKSMLLSQEIEIMSETNWWSEAKPNDTKNKSILTKENKLLWYYRYCNFYCFYCCCNTEHIASKQPTYQPVTSLTSFVYFFMYKTLYKRRLLLLYSICGRM